MSRSAIVFAAVLMGAGVTAAAAQQGQMMNHEMHSHAAMSPADSRQLLQFPPEMQTNFLGNMLDHMQTIDGILQALTKGDYSGASKIASERLGLDSPSAAGCKPKGPDASGAGPVSMKKPPAPGSMDEMMALYMPDAMKSVGLSMHTAASEFAVIATKAAATHDSGAALAALANVTQNCVACHSAYRLR